MMFTERPPGHLILASSSPRRAELMKSAGYQFRVIAPDDDAEDGFRDGERPSDGVARLAYQKAKNKKKTFTGAISVTRHSVRLQSGNPFCAVDA